MDIKKQKRIVFINLLLNALLHSFWGLVVISINVSVINDICGNFFTKNKLITNLLVGLVINVFAYKVYKRKNIELIEYPIVYWFFPG